METERSLPESDEPATCVPVLSQFNPVHAPQPMEDGKILW